MAELIGKIVTLIAWGAIGVNWLQPFADPSLAKGLHYTGIGLAVAHLIETAVFWGKIKAAGDVPRNVLMTLVFGYAHVPYMGKKSA